MSGSIYVKLVLPAKPSERAVFLFRRLRVNGWVEGGSRFARAKRFALRGKNIFVFLLDNGVLICYNEITNYIA